MVRLAGVRRWSDAAWQIQWRHGISPVTMLREYRRFNRAIGINRVEFLYYWLWDVRRPLAERMAIFSDREHYLVDRRINPPVNADRAREKVESTARLEDAGVPVGEVLALIALAGGHEAGTGRYRTAVSEGEVLDLLRDAPPEGMVIKPVRGRGGDGVHVFREAGPTGLVGLDGRVVSTAAFLALLRTHPAWKVERRILAHPVLARIAGPTLGTLRLVTIRMLDGTVHLCQPVWKIPIGDSGLDHYNYGVGSIAAEVDERSGRLGRARRWEVFEHVTHHPETGERIEGVVMPHWAATVACALRVAAAFPELGTLGLDVAVGPEGPILIEVNTNWGQNLTQAPGPTGLVRGRFLRFLEERGCGDVVNLGAREALGLADLD
jgi:hypothetical protein